MNETYEPGDRYAERNILPTLEKVPGDLPIIFTEVLEGPFDKRGMLYRARLLQQLAAEVLKLAEAGMV